MDPQALLRELKAGTLDVARVEDATSRAIFEFAEWLVDPAELGQYPDEIEVLDSRELYWPPAREALPLTMLRYRVRDTSVLEPDDVGVGLVGSMTFSLHSYATHQRPLEDVYAIHCVWECEASRLISTSHKASPKEMEEALSALAIPLANATPVARLELAKRVDYPGDRVLLAAGERDGAAGWLVCDGPRSTWYPASDLPDEAPANTVAMLHVGRVLLGFKTQNVERHTFKTPAYSLGDVDFLDRYERALAVARRGSVGERAGAFDSFGLLARHAPRYVRLLANAGRAEDAKKLIEDLAPYWDHNSGYAALGALAFDAGHFDTAKHFIEKLRRQYKQHYRSETMGLLARIYAREGKHREGIRLLRDCIERIKADKRCSTREVAAFSAPLIAALIEMEP